MATATLTSKGQLTLPKKVREHLHLHEGDRVDFVIEPEGGVRLEPVKRSVRRLKGILHRPGPPVSREEMKRAVAEAMAEEDERIRSYRAEAGFKSA